MIAPASKAPANITTPSGPPTTTRHPPEWNPVKQAPRAVALRAGGMFRATRLFMAGSATPALEGQPGPGARRRSRMLWAAQPAAPCLHSNPLPLAFAKANQEARSQHRGQREARRRRPRRDGCGRQQHRGEGEPGDPDSHHQFACGGRRGPRDWQDTFSASPAVVLPQPHCQLHCTTQCSTACRSRGSTRSQAHASHGAHLRTCRPACRPAAAS